MKPQDKQSLLVNKNGEKITSTKSYLNTSRQKQWKINASGHQKRGKKSLPEKVIKSLRVKKKIKNLFQKIFKITYGEKKAKRITYGQQK